MHKNQHIIKDDTILIFFARNLKILLVGYTFRLLQVFSHEFQALGWKSKQSLGWSTYLIQVVMILSAGGCLSWKSSKSKSDNLMVYGDTWMILFFNSKKYPGTHSQQSVWPYQMNFLSVGNDDAEIQLLGDACDDYCMTLTTTFTSRILNLWIVVLQIFRLDILWMVNRLMVKSIMCSATYNKEHDFNLLVHQYPNWCTTVDDINNRYSQLIVSPDAHIFPQNQKISWLCISIC